MARKQPAKDPVAEVRQDVPAGAPGPKVTKTRSKESSASPANVPQYPPPELSTSTPFVCRNKHWRYISSFLGPWLHQTPESLETIATGNFYLPRPQLVDPAILFDLVKIRRLVDEATDLAVCATNGTTSSARGNCHHASNGFPGRRGTAALGFGIRGGGPNTKLSKERRHRMRQHATQMLSHAYNLDEIAASVAAMQSASVLEQVAKDVLTRNEDDPDASYVHFFHEKIPSRSLAQSTSLSSLDLVISQRPTDGAPYRTRAVARMLKGDFRGATTDLTEGLRVCRLYNTPLERQNEQTEFVLPREAAGGQRKKARVDEKDQPCSLEGQLLFHRAGTYLTMACDNIATALHKPTAHDNDDDDVLRGDRGGKAEAPTSTTKSDRGANQRRLDAHKLVRTYAKRALRDYTAFIARFNYTPGNPAEISQTLIAKVCSAPNELGRRWQENSLLEMAKLNSLPEMAKPNQTARTSASVKHNAHSPMQPGRPAHGLPLPPTLVYPLDELFSAVPPSNLPPFPVESTGLVRTGHRSQSYLDHPNFSEIVTYHPLLTDALHSLLLCHCLIRTSPKEILRHAYMVARLARISDGFPIFVAASSPARVEWAEVVRRAQNWLGLSASWDSLCAPARFPGQKEPEAETIEQRRERIRREAVREALADETVVDEESFRASVRTRAMRAMREEEDGTGLGHLGAQEGGEEAWMMMERAEAIARWIKEAPQPGEGGEREEQS